VIDERDAPEDVGGQALSWWKSKLGDAVVPAFVEVTVDLAGRGDSRARRRHGRRAHAGVKKSSLWRAQPHYLLAQREPSTAPGDEQFAPAVPLQPAFVPAAAQPVVRVAEVTARHARPCRPKG